ncbi:MAG TPA: hypothetical protein VMG38_00490 [Trebonia sp.]|nr:hypothetical protein [Trebonia sp.]
MTVNADGTSQPSPADVSRRLPGWARDMAGQYPAYEFAPLGGTEHPPAGG